MKVFEVTASPKPRVPKENVTDETKIIRIMREIARPAGLEIGYKKNISFPNPIAHQKTKNTFTLSFEWQVADKIDISSLYSGGDLAIQAKLRAKNPRKLDAMIKVIDAFVKELLIQFPNLRGVQNKIMRDAKFHDEVPAKNYSLTTVKKFINDDTWTFGSIKLIFEN